MTTLKTEHRDGIESRQGAWREPHGLFLRPAGYLGPLRLTSASKVREWPGQANGFSLPAIPEVCVFATSTCWSGCYAKRGRMAFPIPQKAFMANFQALSQARCAGGMAELLIELLDWMKFGIFRIHVSGEFFSAEYAEAWHRTCAEYETAQFWSYTRSRDPAVLGTLAQIPNLRVLLSCDQDNWQEMLAVSQDYPCFGLSYYTVGEDPPDEVRTRASDVPVESPTGLVVFPDQKVRRYLSLSGTCPTETAINPWPKQEACVRCRRCWQATGPTKRKAGFQSRACLSVMNKQVSGGESR